MGPGVVMAGAGGIVVLLPVGEESPLRSEPVRVASRLGAAGGADVTVIVAGESPDSGAVAAAAAGAARAWIVSDPSFAERFDAEQLLAIFLDALSSAEILGGRVPALVLLPPGAVEEELAARLAARLGGVALGRCLDIVPGESGLLATRSAYGGRVMARLETAAAPCVAVVTPATSPPESGSDARAAEIHLIRSTAEVPGRELVRRAAGVAAREMRVEQARVIVSGGRGMGGAEGFAVLKELAGRLDGAVGGSLPAADAGWIPVSRQIGQSGKRVAPEVYVAVGLSGTIQHLAGVAGSARIVAINSDPEAAIFALAEVGAVGDWRQVLPALVETLKRGGADGEAPPRRGARGGSR